MRHQNERRRTTLVRQPFEKLQKMLACDRIESGARLVENQQLRTRHQRPPYQHALTLALRQKTPRPIAQRLGLDLAQYRERLQTFPGRNFAPHSDHRMASADYRVKRRLMTRHHLADARTHNPDPLAQLAPVGPSIGLARAVGAEDRPMLPTLDHPVDRTKYQRVALDSQTRNFDNWRKSFRLSRPVRARSAMVVSGARSAMAVSGLMSHSYALKRGYHAGQETAPPREYIRGAFRSEGNAWFLESLCIRPALRRQSPCQSAPGASSPRPRDLRR